MKKTILSMLAALMLLAVNPAQATVGPPTAAGQIEIAFAQAARAHGVREGHLRAICYAETGYWSAEERPAKVSPTGAQGFCQITTVTAADRCPPGLDRFQLFENIDCAARILRWQMTHYCGTDFECNAGSYLRGPRGHRENLQQNAAVWPDYLRRAEAFLYKYESALAARAALLAVYLGETELALAVAGGAL